jgi:hypothetical protein
MPDRRFVTFSANSVAGEKELRWVFAEASALFLSLPTSRAFRARFHAFDIW